MPRYIDADAFLLAEIERCGSQPVVGTCTMDNEYLSIRVADAPTLSPDDVRGVGEWEDANQHGLCGCSVCKDCYIEQWYIKRAKWKFCPNCGVRMEVSGDA